MNNKACKDSTEGERRHVLKLNLDFLTGYDWGICITSCRVFSQLAQAAQRSSYSDFFFPLLFPVSLSPAPVASSVSHLTLWFICLSLCHRHHNAVKVGYSNLLSKCLNSQGKDKLFSFQLIHLGYDDTCSHSKGIRLEKAVAAALSFITSFKGCKYSFYSNLLNWNFMSIDQYWHFNSWNIRMCVIVTYKSILIVPLVVAVVPGWSNTHRKICVFKQGFYFEN